MNAKRNIDMECGQPRRAKVIVREYEPWRLRCTARRALSSVPDTNTLKGRELIRALELEAPVVPEGLREVLHEHLDPCKAHFEHPIRLLRPNLAPDIVVVSKDFQSRYYKPI